MSESIESPLHLEAFAIRVLNLEIAEEPRAGSPSASVDLDYELYQHATEDAKFRIELKVNVRGGDSESDDFTLAVVADAVVTVPEGASEDERGVLLNNGVALLYSTLRGSLAGVLGQTRIRGFVLPAVNMNKVVERLASEPAASTVRETRPPARGRRGNKRQRDAG